MTTSPSPSGCTPPASSSSLSRRCPGSLSSSGASSLPPSPAARMRAPFSTSARRQGSTLLPSARYRRTMWTTGLAAAHRGGDADQLMGLQAVLRAPLQLERELSCDHHVHLLLALVAMDAPALARLQRDQVHAERLHAQLPAQRAEALPLQRRGQ